MMSEPSVSVADVLAMVRGMTTDQVGVQQMIQELELVDLRAALVDALMLVQIARTVGVDMTLEAWCVSIAEHYGDR
jgi:hypothetical protein